MMAKKTVHASATSCALWKRVCLGWKHLPYQSPTATILIQCCASRMYAPERVDKKARSFVWCARRCLQFESSSLCTPLKETLIVREKCNISCNPRDVPRGI